MEIEDGDSNLVRDTDSIEFLKGERDRAFTMSTVHSEIETP